MNIVYNDYRDDDELAIFKPFFTLAPASSPKLNGSPVQANGTSA